MDKRMRETVRRIEGAGLHVERITYRGKHPKLFVSDGKRVRRVTVPFSASDWRAARNMMKVLRREFGSES